MKNWEGVGAKVLSLRRGFACRPMDKLDHPDRFLISIFNKSKVKYIKQKQNLVYSGLWKARRVWEQVVHSVSEQMNKR